MKNISNENNLINCDIIFDILEEKSAVTFLLKLKNTNN